jgi:acetoin utilization protein AcuB
MRVQDVMTPKVETIPAAASAEVAWQKMVRKRIHHLVVTEDSRIVGILSDRDLGGARQERQRRGRSVAELMSANAVTASADMTLRKAANLMRGRSLGCLPVVDDGHLKGIITVTDLLEMLGRGAMRPIERSERWTLRKRSPRLGARHA